MILSDACSSVTAQRARGAIAPFNKLFAAVVATRISSFDIQQTCLISGLSLQPRAVRLPSQHRPRPKLLLKRSGRVCLMPLLDRAHMLIFGTGGRKVVEDSDDEDDPAPWVAILDNCQIL